MRNENAHPRPINHIRKEAKPQNHDGPQTTLNQPDLTRSTILWLHVHSQVGRFQNLCPASRTTTTSIDQEGDFATTETPLASAMMTYIHKALDQMIPYDRILAEDYHDPGALEAACTLLSTTRCSAVKATMEVLIPWLPLAHATIPSALVIR